MPLSMQQALRIEGPKCVAFIGSGGKTTALFKLSRELDKPIVVTATTHLGAWQATLADNHLVIEKSTTKILLQEINGVMLVTGAQEDDRYKPVEQDTLDQLREICKEQSIPMLIEADGSRQKPLKGWEEYEPPIPDFTDLVVQVAGLSALGKPLDSFNVHRAEIFSRLAGLEAGQIITPESIIRVLTNPESSIRAIPSTAQRTVLLNQADSPELQAAAKSIAKNLLGTYRSGILASLKFDRVHAVHERIAGIVLAAGSSSRIGTPKQVLDWKGKPFVRVVAETALRSGLDPVIVVVGAHSESVEAALIGLQVKIVRNTNWAEGQASSVRGGVSALPHESGGAIFLLADQPQIGGSIIQALMEKHSEGLYPAIVPMVMDRRANPVLFDRITFPDLMQIEGDTGGRAILHKHRVEYLPWHDDALLLDVDTPEQYHRLISSEDL